MKFKIYKILVFVTMIFKYIFLIAHQEETLRPKLNLVSVF